MREHLHPPRPAPPPVGVDAWCAAFAYEGVARELVARVKYRNVRAVVPWLAVAMVTAFDRLDAVPGRRHLGAHQP